MKIQYLSDLHIDSSNMARVPKAGDVLVVAGDVSVEDSLLQNFFERNLPWNVPTIFVPGNHEHECKDVLRSREYFSELLVELPHVHVLQNSSMRIEDVEFFGATLWSDFEGSGVCRGAALKEWASRISDFVTIRHGQRAIAPDDMALVSKQSQAELARMLQASSAPKKVVVTHFAPHSLSGDARHLGALSSGYWCNDLPHLLRQADLWIHGHVHESKDYRMEGCRVMCNPRGYSETYDLAENLSFNPAACVDI